MRGEGVEMGRRRKIGVGGGGKLNFKNVFIEH